MLKCVSNVLRQFCRLTIQQLLLSTAFSALSARKLIHSDVDTDPDTDTQTHNTDIKQLQRHSRRHTNIKQTLI